MFNSTKLYKPFYDNLQSKHLRNNKPSDHKMRKLIGKNSYYKSLSNNLKLKNSLVSQLYEQTTSVDQLSRERQVDGNANMSKGGQEAQHDNDRLRMINQGGVEMSMGRDPY